MFGYIIEVTNFSIHLIFKFKQYKNANISIFVFYGKLICSNELLDTCQTKSGINFKVISTFATFHSALCRSVGEKLMDVLIKFETLI